MVDPALTLWPGPFRGRLGVLALVAALAAISLTAPAQPAGARPSDPEKTRRALEDRIYNGQGLAAAMQAARLAQDPGTTPALKRVGRYIRCHVLFEHFRASLSNPRVAEEVGRQTERAWLDFLKNAANESVDLKARFLLGLFYQDRARWRLGLNDVLYAAEIARDLSASNHAFVALARLIPADTSHEELAGLRSWARTYVPINFYYLARIHAPGTERRTFYLSQALDRLEKTAQAYPGLPAGNRAYFYYALAWLLYGSGDGPGDNEARQKAREVFLDLWKSVPWTPGYATFKEEVLWQLCRLDASTGHPGQVVAAVTLLKQKLDAADQPPSRFTVQALGEAALARVRVQGARAAADGLEADLDWLENRAGMTAARRLWPTAVRLAPVLVDVVTPGSHPRVMLLVAQGWNQAGEPLGALAWSARLASARTLPSTIRSAAWEVASRAWEARGFLREALVALDQAGCGGPGSAGNGGTDSGASMGIHRRAALLWQRLARASGTARDWLRLEALRAHLPGQAGKTAYETGLRAFARGALTEAIAWFQRVDADSHFHALALAMQAHILYRQWKSRGAVAGGEAGIRNLLLEIDRLSPRTPNWLPAQSLRYLTQAMLKKALGDRQGALADLEGFEDQFADQPHLVSEALKVRMALHLEHDGVAAARTALAALIQRFPAHRATGEACLFLGRRLRRAPVAPPGRGPAAAAATGHTEQAAENATERTARRCESLHLRQRAEQILGRAFPGRDRYLLAVDEMAHDAWDRALARLDALKRENPAWIRSIRDGLDLRRARCLMALDRLAPATRILDELRQRNPHHLEPLRWTAYLRGGTLEKQGDRFVERRHLNQPVEAFSLWERIKEHAERSTPFGPLWFEAQFHMALLNYWSGHPERVRAIVRWIEASDYDPCGAHPWAAHFRWLLERLDQGSAKK